MKANQTYSQVFKEEVDLFQAFNLLEIWLIIEKVEFVRQIISQW
jgi:hypothetical protein